FKEVGRPAAEVANDVHGRHGEAGAVRQHADIAVELDELQTVFRTTLFQRGHRSGGPEPDDVPLPIGGGIVEHEFALERYHAPIPELRQRIDLKKLSVAPSIGRIEARKNICDAYLRIAELQASQHRDEIDRARLDVQIDVLAPDRIGFGGRDLLNVHAALRREQNERLARVRIGQNGRIEFMRDVRLFLD